MSIAYIVYGSLSWVCVCLSLQPRMSEIRNTIQARSAQINKLRSKVDGVEDEVGSAHACTLCNVGPVKRFSNTHNTLIFL